MKKEAILHVPMSNYAHGITEGRLVIRLRALRGDIKSCRLYYGDTACRKTPIDFFEIDMEVVAQDEFFDYFEAEFDSRFHRVYYYFELSDETETVYYYADFFHEGLVDDRSEYYKLPFNRREDIAAVPAWVRDAVIYNIFPDSFATWHRGISGEGSVFTLTDGKHTKGRLGGTIRGIEENVDYLTVLGINCIYINPIFTAGEYHKYDILDYFHVDPCFGSNEDFRHMVNVLHESGIRVIIDGVFNHCGWEFFAFEDVVKNGEESIYADWFYRLEYPVVRPDNPQEIPGYECFAYERMMPKLNTSNPEVMKYLIEVGTYWVREFDIDGWRLDVASEVDDTFWREFRRAVKAVKQDCFIIGEVWETAPHWLDGSMFDSTMNYDLRKHCRYFFAEKSIDALQFDARVSNMRMRYKKNLLAGQLNLLDSHDVPRFLSICGENVRSWRQAVVFQMMFVGAPSVFYGDEQQLCGIEEHDYRRQMCWNMECESFRFYRCLIDIRKKYSAVTSNGYKTISAEPGSGLYVFERGTDHEGERIIVALNTGRKPESIRQELLQGRILLSEIFDEGQRLLGEGGYIILET